jgi:hypothetical protein
MIDFIGSGFRVLGFVSAASQQEGTGRFAAILVYLAIVPCAVGKNGVIMGPGSCVSCFKAGGHEQHDYIMYRCAVGDFVFFLNMQGIGFGVWVSCSTAVGTGSRFAAAMFV